MSPPASSPFACMLGALALALGGCASYTSDYVPPQDGRARVLYNDNSAFVSLPPSDPACLQELAAASGGPTYRGLHSGGVGGAHIVYWVPIIHPLPLPLPPPLPGIPPLIPGPHVAAGGAVASGRQFASPSAGSGHVSAGHASGHASGGGSGHSSSGGGGGGLGKGTEVLVVVVIVALPIVTFAIALSSPEPSQDLSAAIDRANLYNDIARSPGSPCAELIEPAPPPGAPPPPPPVAPAPPEEP